jgi:hypothetical protein
VIDLFVHLFAPLLFFDARPHGELGTDRVNEMETLAAGKFDYFLTDRRPEFLDPRMIAM